MISADTVMPGSYDYLQVFLSGVMAISASYAALDLAGRVTAASGWARSVWLTGGAVAMGIGIWSMHFTGMLAFHLPVPVGYDWPTVLLSLLAAIISSVFALYVASRQKMGFVRALTCGAILGAGIAGVHYIGMAAMRLGAVCRFNPLLVTLSLGFAIAFSVFAFLLTFDLREETKGTPLRKIASAAVMGAAISGMHYTGMASVSFIPSTATPHISHTVSVSALDSAGISTVTLIVLGVAILTSAVNRLRTSDAHTKLIVLLTDGRSNTGAVDPLTAAKTVAAYGIRVYAIGTAGRGPATMTVDDPSQGKVTVQIDDDLDDELLAQIAQLTGGKSYRAQTSGELKKVFADINGLEKSEIKRPPVVAVADHHVPLVALALALLLAESGLAATALLRWP